MLPNSDGPVPTAPQNLAKADRLRDAAPRFDAAVPVSGFTVEGCGLQGAGTCSAGQDLSRELGSGRRSRWWRTRPDRRPSGRYELRCQRLATGADQALDLVEREGLSADRE